MTASILPLLRVVNGPNASQLWNAAQPQRSLYFSVRANGQTAQQTGVMRLTGVPLSLGAAYGQLSNLGVRFFVPEFELTLDGQYDSITRAGTLTCSITEAPLALLGLDPAIVGLLAEKGVHKVAEVLPHTEYIVSDWMVGDLMGYSLNEHFVQQALRRFYQLRERLQELDPALQFKGGQVDELSLFYSFA